MSRQECGAVGKEVMSAHAARAQKLRRLRSHACHHHEVMVDHFNIPLAFSVFWPNGLRDLTLAPAVDSTAISCEQLVFMMNWFLHIVCVVLLFCLSSSCFLHRDRVRLWTARLPSHRNMLESFRILNILAFVSMCHPQCLPTPLSHLPTSSAIPSLQSYRAATHYTSTSNPSFFSLFPTIFSRSLENNTPPLPRAPRIPGLIPIPKSSPRNHSNPFFRIQTRTLPPRKTLVSRTHLPPRTRMRRQQTRLVQPACTRAQRVVV